MEPNDERIINLKSVGLQVISILAKQNVIMELLIDERCKGMSAEDKQKFYEAVKRSEMDNYERLFDSMKKPD